MHGSRTRSAMPVACCSTSDVCLFAMQCPTLLHVQKFHGDAAMLHGSSATWSPHLLNKRNMSQSVLSRACVECIEWVQIRDTEYHMAHESIPIAQERQTVKHIKKLRDSRQRVRQYEELYAGVETARAAVRSGQVELKEMLDERQVEHLAASQVAQLVARPSASSVQCLPSAASLCLLNAELAACQQLHLMSAV